VRRVKKKVALSIAGATAALLGGWKLVQQMVDRDEEPQASGPESASWTTATPSTAPPTAPSGPGAGPEPKPAPPMTAAKAAATGLDEKSSKAELYEIATELKIPGRSKMSKSELLAAIRSAS